MVFYKHGVFKIRDWKMATDIIGEPSTMMAELLRDKEGLRSILLPDDEVVINLTIVVRRKMDG